VFRFIEILHEHPLEVLLSNQQCDCCLGQLLLSAVLEMQSFSQ